jgi:hypothetical protein
LNAEPFEPADDCGAARRLGVVARGTARVKITVIGRG